MHCTTWIILNSYLQLTGTVLLRYYLLVMMDSNCIHALTTASLNTDLATSLGENSPTVSDMSSVSLG